MINQRNININEEQIIKKDPTKHINDEEEQWKETKEEKKLGYRNKRALEKKIKQTQETIREEKE